MPSLSRVVRSFALIGCALLLPVAATSQTTQNSVELDVPSYESELDRVAESIKHPEQIPELLSLCRAPGPCKWATNPSRSPPIGSLRT